MHNWSFVLSFFLILFFLKNENIYSAFYPVNDIVWAEGEVANLPLGGMMHLRSSPGVFKNNSIGTLPVTQDIQVLNETRISNWGPVWYRIRYWKNGKIQYGWISGKHVKIQKFNNKVGRVAGVPKDDRDGGLRLRICPKADDNQCPHLAIIPNGAPLQILGQNTDGWYHIVANVNGQLIEGWVKGDYLDETNEDLIVTNVQDFLNRVDKSINALKLLADCPPGNSSATISDIFESKKEIETDENTFPMIDENLKMPIKDLKPSAHVIALIKHFESSGEYDETLYNCPAGCATIGFGHLVHNDRVGTNPNAEAPFRGNDGLLRRISENEAEELLHNDIKRVAINPLKKHLGEEFELTQNQFDALVSFTFNLGGEILKVGKKDPSIKELLEAGRFSEVPDILKTFKKAGGVVLPGLIARRFVEAELFMGRKVGLK
jgi:GH24 family phage-related lysozyme (muramidase)